MIALLWQYRKYVFIAAGIALLLASFLFYRGSLIKKGEAIERMRCNAEKQATIESRIDIKKDIDSVTRTSTNADYIGMLDRGEL